MHNFRELKIWNHGMSLVKKCYLLTSELPHDEKYGLTVQIQRSAVSIPANIAEGSGKSSNKDFCRYLEIAISSAFELETLILLTYDLGLISNTKKDELINPIRDLQKMIYSFKNSLKNN